MERKERSAATRRRCAKPACGRPAHHPTVIGWAPPPCGVAVDAGGGMAGAHGLSHAVIARWKVRHATAAHAIM